MLTKALVVWFALAVLAVGNGFAREALLAPRMAELAAHQLSCLSLSILILITVTVVIPWFGVRSVQGWLGIGALWLTLTVTFEFLLGRLVAKHSWARLLNDYDLLSGRLWILVLLVTLLAPLIAARIRRS